MLPTDGPLALMQAWVDQHPRYAYTATVWEQPVGGAPEAGSLRVTYDPATHVETIHVISGRSAGTDVRWTGGETVAVRGPGLAHMITLSLPIRASMLLSPRKNDLRVTLFAGVAACYIADAAHVVAVDNGSTIELTDTDPHCGEGYGPDPVTADRLTLDARTGAPIERVRLNGTTVVVRWTISDLDTR